MLVLTVMETVNMIKRWYRDGMGTGIGRGTSSGYGLRTTCGATVATVFGQQPPRPFDRTGSLGGRI